MNTLAPQADSESFERRLQSIATDRDYWREQAQKVGSVLEDAARWQALESCVLEINGGKDWMSIVPKDDAKPEPFLKGMLADKLAALAARKQGGA